MPKLAKGVWCKIELTEVLAEHTVEPSHQLLWMSVTLVINGPVFNIINQMALKIQEKSSTQSNESRIYLNEGDESTHTVFLLSIW